MFHSLARSTVRMDPVRTKRMVRTPAPATRHAACNSMCLTSMCVRGALMAPPRGIVSSLLFHAIHKCFHLRVVEYRVLECRTCRAAVACSRLTHTQTHTHRCHKHHGGQSTNDVHSASMHAEQQMLVCAARAVTQIARPPEREVAVTQLANFASYLGAALGHGPSQHLDRHGVVLPWHYQVRRWHEKCKNA